MGRFDYTKYDEKANGDQAYFKDICTALEAAIETTLKAPRYKALALTKLEECYMYIGKAVRDDQIARLSPMGKVVELQEERG